MSIHTNSDLRVSSLHACVLERDAYKSEANKQSRSLGPAERSEAPPREARQAAEGGQHFDVPELREGRQGKLEATQLPRLGCRELARGG